MKELIEELGKNISYIEHRIEGYTYHIVVKSKLSESRCPCRAKSSKVHSIYVRTNTGFDDTREKGDFGTN